MCGKVAVVVCACVVARGRVGWGGGAPGSRGCGLAGWKAAALAKHVAFPEALDVQEGRSGKLLEKPLAHARLKVARVQQRAHHRNDEVAWRTMEQG